METAMTVEVQVVQQLSGFERVVKMRNHDGLWVLSHQYCNSDAHWRPCCPPVPLSVYTDERALFTIQRCPHYGKRNGHETILPALHKHH